MTTQDNVPEPRESVLGWLRNLLLGVGALHLSFKYLMHAAIEGGFTTYGFIVIGQICLVWLMVFATAAFLTRRWPPVLRITRGDIAFLFIFLFISGPFMMGTMYFFRSSTYAYYHGDRNAVTKTLLEQNLPRLAPNDDAVLSLHTRSQDGRIEWRPWFSSEHGVPPILAWGLFLTFFLGMSFALVFIFSRRWLEDEQLAFPMARVGELFIDGFRDPTTRARLSLFGTRAFWAGFIITFLFQIATYYSPGLEWRLGSFGIKDTVPLLGNLDYPSRQFWWRPVFVGLFFLCPRQILGSAIFFHVLQCIFTIIGGQLGYKGYTGSELPGASAFPFKPDQLIGGALAMSVVMLWLSRRYLAAQFKALWPRPRSAGKRQAHEPSPLAAAVFLVSIVGFIVWTLFIGFSLRTTAVFLFCMLLGMIINTRGRAETGMPMVVVFSDFLPFDMVTLVGTKIIGVATVAATALHGWLFWNNMLHVTPSIMDALKLGQILRRSAAWTCAVAIAAVASGVLLGAWVTLDSAYEIGMNTWKFGYGSGSYQASMAVRLMQREVGVNWLHLSYSLAGGVLVAGLWFCRTIYPGFMLHPMGYLLSLHSGLHHFSLALIVAYVIKTLSIHYGGMKTYAPLVPFFIGLLVGQIIGGVTGGVLNGILGTTNYIPMI